MSESGSLRWPRPRSRVEQLAQAWQRTAGYIAESDNKEVDPVREKVDTVDKWDFVASTAITDEYMESMYMAVSSI